jgi:hypothetical protein
MRPPDRAEGEARLSRSNSSCVADATLSILGEPSPAEQQVSSAVEQVLGRAPRTFAEWAVRNAAAFR